MPIVELRDLKKYYPIKGGFFRRTIAQLKAVDGVSFSIEPSTTFGLVGESGCGKSTLGRTVLGLHEATEGQVLFDGKDITHEKGADWISQRRQMQIIFQDPYGSLNPRFTVREIIREPLDTHNIGDAHSRNERVHELLSVVGLRPAVIDRYPHEFSGGQRQRVGIARALALNPRFIVADEPVSALDVSVQSQVLNLIKDLQDQFGIAFLFISHDLAVVQHISHEVGVMYFGKLVERAPSLELYENPKHPYTQSLISAVPQPDPENKSQHQILEGDIPNHRNPPQGCPFHPRCPVAKPECKTEKPILKNLGTEEKPHHIACHLY